MTTTTKPRRERKVPQATAAPAAPSAPSLAEAQRIIAEARMVEAEDLDYEGFKIDQRININRTQLRQMQRAGELTDEQSQWLDTWYREKRSNHRATDEQIAATKDLHEKSRKARKAAEDGKN